MIGKPNVPRPLGQPPKRVGTKVKDQHRIDTRDKMQERTSYKKMKKKELA
jgi:hypothetical protein